MKQILLLGGGGHAKVVLDALQSSKLNVIGFLEQNTAIEELSGIKRIGDTHPSDIPNYPPAEVILANGFGSTWKNSLRKDQYELWKAHGYQFITVIHPTAIIANDVVLEEGGQIMAGAVVQPGVTIGENALINTRAAIDHDCTIGAHVHIATGASISGEVRVDDGAHIGTGATVIQGIHIGEASVVGAGSVVVRDVNARTQVMGVPAHHHIRQLDKNRL
ncbi:MAG: acetyltransferase [Rhodothermales bacterium]